MDCREPPRLPCPSSTCEVCLNPCQLSRWCHPTISSSVIPLSSCPQSFSTSGSFPMSQFFTSGGQSTGASASASASILPMNIQDWFPLGELVWSPCSLKDSQESSPTPEFKNINSLALSLLYRPILTGKTMALIRQTFVDTVISLLFNMLSMLFITFLPISWLQSLSAVILEAKKIKSITLSIGFHLFAMKWWGQRLWS